MKSAKKASIISYLTVGFYLVTGFFYTPFLIKTLGVSDYAIFALTASLVGYFSLDFGIGAAQTRYIAKLLAQNNRAKISDLLGISSKLYFIIDAIIIVILCIIYFYSDKIFTGFTPDELSRFQKVFIITAIFIMINIPLLPVNGVLIGFDRAYDLTLINAIYRFTSITFLFCALVLNMGLYWIVIVNVGCQALAQLFKYYYIKYKEHLSVNYSAVDKEINSYLAKFSIWATVGMIADKFFFGIIPFLLAIVSNSNEIAVFAIVISLEGYTLSISKALNGIFLPRIAKMVVENRSPEQLTNLMIKVGRVQLYIIGFIIFGIVTFGFEFIYLWLGPGFEKSYFCILLVLIPCLFHLTQTIAEETLLATNNVKYRAIANIIVSLLSVSSILLLGHYLGALAAGIGVFLSFVIGHNITIDIFYHKRVKINIKHFLSHCHGRILPVFIIGCTIGLIIQYFLSDNVISHFISRIAVWSTGMVILLWAYAFNEEEKTMLKQLFKRK